MTRKANIYSSVLGHEPVEILGYNPRRIKASIYPDWSVGIDVIAFGMSGQQVLSASATYIYYSPFVWEGINELWAALALNVSAPQGYTVVELVDE